MERAVSAEPVAQEPMPTSQTEKVFRSAGVTSFAVLASRLTGLVREGVMSRLFGASAAYDAFLIAFRVPNLTRDLFAEGALSAAFVPTFVEYLQKQGKREAAHLANLVATLLLIVVGTLCALGIWASPWLVGLIAHNWRTTDPAKYQLAVLLTQVMFPYLLLVALSAQAMGVLNACNRFAVPAFSATMFNLGSVAGGVVIGFLAGPSLGISPIEGMAFGVVLGGVLQLLWQVPSLLKEGIAFRLAFDFAHPGVRRIVRLMGPGIIGNASVQVNVLVTSFLATSLLDPVRGHDGPVAWLSYAFRFMQLPIGLFGVAIATATLPSIGRSAAARNIAEFRETLARSLGLTFVLTIPSSIGLIVLGNSIIGLIYQGAKFRAYDTERTALALACYALGLAGYSAIKILSPAFYALNDSRVPMMTSLASIVVNAGLGYLFAFQFGWGHAGLALATAFVTNITCVLQFWLMSRRIGGMQGRRIARVVVKVTLASLAMAALVGSMHYGFRWVLPRAMLVRICDVLFGVPAGALVVFALCRAMHVEELATATRVFGGPLLRRFPALAARIGM
jgi:putative peptidoglycan lipid II flippase